jgi:hypothetical protein
MIKLNRYAFRKLICAPRLLYVVLGLLACFIPMSTQSNGSLTSFYLKGHSYGLLCLGMMLCALSYLHDHREEKGMASITKRRNDYDLAKLISLCKLVIVSEFVLYVLVAALGPYLFGHVTFGSFEKVALSYCYVTFVEMLIIVITALIVRMSHTLIYSFYITAASYGLCYYYFSNLFNIHEDLTSSSMLIVAIASAILVFIILLVRFLVTRNRKL